MKLEIVKIQELPSLFIYSVCEVKDNRSVAPSSFRDFKTRMNAGSAKDKRQFQELSRIITIMGNSKDGASEEYFRREGIAMAMPSHIFKFRDSDEKNGDFGLRWYCIRITNSIVILLNGDRKTTQDPEECPNCASHFSFAISVAEKTYDALNSGEIELAGREIIFDDDFYLNI